MRTIITPANTRLHANVRLTVTTEIATQRLTTEVSISGQVDPEHQQQFVDDIEAVLAKYKDPDEIPF